MSKATTTLSNTPQQLAAGPVILTVKKASAGAQVTLMNAEDDVNPLVFPVQAQDQFIQYDAEATWASCSGSVDIIADGELS